MRRIDTVPATLEHAQFVGERLRQAEVDELWALAQVAPLEACRIAVERSERAWAWRVNGQPAAIYGVQAPSLIGTKGVPWLLTTTDVDRHPVSFLRACASAVREMGSAYPQLENWVDARYTMCVRWLSWLGFTIHPAAPYGALGLPFHRFEMTYQPGEAHAAPASA